MCLPWKLYYVQYGKMGGIMLNMVKLAFFMMYILFAFGQNK